MSVAPVTDQPTGNDRFARCWMSKPDDSADCPIGLEYLTGLNQLTIQQELDISETFSTTEIENSYKILNTTGEVVYSAAEKSGEGQRQCCGSYRGFTMHIRDSLGMDVIRCKKKFACCGGCGFCACSDGCANYMEVEAPAGYRIGTIRQEMSLGSPRFKALDEHGKTLFYLHGPCCTCQCLCCPRDVQFQVLSEDKSHLGSILKTWSGIDQELFSNADNFQVSFPQNLDIKTKVIMTGAVFLIDFMFFEESHDHNRKSRIV